MHRAVLVSLLVLAPCLVACGDDDSGGPDAGADAGLDAGMDAGPDAAPDAARPTSIRFDIAPDLVVIREGGDLHVAFPDVVRLPSGGLLVAYREAEVHGVDPTGRILMQTGSADGMTWGEPEVLVDTPDVDDRDLSLSVLASGEIAASFFQYVYEPTPDGQLSVHQNFLGRSTDGGLTFGDFVQVGDGAMSYPDASLDATSELWVDQGGEPILVRACSSPVREVAGRLLLPSYGGNVWNSGNSAAPRSIISFFASTDGETWAEEPIAPGQATDTWLQEPSVLALDDQRLIVHLRTAEGASPGNAGPMMQTRSSDNGATWEALTSFAFTGHAPYLHRLPNGVLLSAFRELNAALTRAAVSFVYSLDDGDTWSEPVQIISWQPTEMGYPSIVDLDGDRFLVVFYYAGALIEAAFVDYTAS